MERELWQRQQLIKLHVLLLSLDSQLDSISQLPCSQVWLVESNGM